MSESVFSEDQAAATLRPPVNPRTLRRWRVSGKVPFSRTPGGRIFYTFEQLVEIGARMRMAASVPTCPDLSGESAEAAE